MSVVEENVDVGDRAAAERNQIVRVTVGSDLHGMAIPGTDDNDEMGVYLPAPTTLLGVQPPTEVVPTPEHWISRTVPNGHRSRPGDTDLSMYSLRKYVRLALEGNPTILTLLYAPESAVLHITRDGEQLRALAPEIVSQRAVHRFLGYLDGQRERLLGGGKQNRVPNRPELVEAHGYDTKYASHALRLGLQGIQLADHGRLTYPLDPFMLDYVMEVKRGEVDFATALGRIDVVRQDLAHRIEQGMVNLPPEPDMDAVNAWMIGTHIEFWKTHYSTPYWK